jgi:hypothetical protein
MNNITDVLIGSAIGSALGLTIIFVVVPTVLKGIIWVDRKWFGRTW